MGWVSLYLDRRRQNSMARAVPALNRLRRTLGAAEFQGVYYIVAPMLVDLREQLGGLREFVDQLAKRFYLRNLAWD